MHGLIDFYERAATGQPNVIQRGEIYEDQPIYLPAAFGIRIRKTNPVTNAIEDIELTHNRREIIFDHPPIMNPKLPNGEALVVGKAKWARPVVVLASEGIDLLPGPDKARPSNTFLCAPIYGADQFTQEKRGSVRAYEYPNLFYLPESKVPIFEEGFVRLDHVQAIHKLALRRRKPVRLTEEALIALEEWLFHYLTGRLPADSLIADYQREAHSGFAATGK